MTSENQQDGWRWYEWVRWGAVILGGLGSVATAVLFWMVIDQGKIQIEQIRRERALRTVRDVFREWDSENLTQDRFRTNAWLSSHPSTPLSEAPVEVQAGFQDVVDYFEILGYMVDREMIEEQHVDALMSPLVVRYWCAYRDRLERMGQREGEWFKDFAENWMDRSGKTCEDL